MAESRWPVVMTAVLPSRPGMPLLPVLLVFIVRWHGRPVRRSRDARRGLSALFAAPDDRSELASHGPVVPGADLPGEAASELAWRLAELRPGMSVLDLACGHGELANRLAARGCQVTGLDSSTVFLDRARADAAAAGVSADYVAGDMRQLPWTGRFDRVLNWSTAFEYFDDTTNRAGSVRSQGSHAQPGPQPQRPVGPRGLLVRDPARPRRGVRCACWAGVCQSGLVSGDIAYQDEPLEPPAAGSALLHCSRPAATWSSTCEDNSQVACRNSPRGLFRAGFLAARYRPGAPAVSPQRCPWGHSHL